MSKNRFAFGALIGIIAGAIAGVLAAPKSGKETRSDIKLKAVELKKDASARTEKVKLQSEKVTTEVKDKAKDYRERSERAVEGAVEGAKKGFYDKK